MSLRDLHVIDKISMQIFISQNNIVLVLKCRIVSFKLRVIDMKSKYHHILLFFPLSLNYFAKEYR